MQMEGKFTVDENAPKTEGCNDGGSLLAGRGSLVMYPSKV